MKQILAVLAILAVFSCETPGKKQPVILSGRVIHKMEHRGQLTLLVKKDTVVAEVPVTLEEWEKAGYGKIVELDTVRDEYNNQLKYKLKP